MLLRLQPDQVARYWDILKYAIEGSFPPSVMERPDMNKVLEALLGGVMLSWVSVDDKSKKIVAIVTTTVSDDPCTGTKNLVLYTIFAMAEKIGRHNWVEGFNTLMKYAKGIGCNRLVAFTKVDAVKALARYFGGDTDWTFISLNVDSYGN